MSYEERKAQSQTWAFTISDSTNERKHVKTDYQQFWKRCEQHGLIIEEKEREVGEKNKVPHYHGIIQIPRGFYRKKLMIHGISLKLEELYNRAGWMKYINKTHNIVPLPQPDDELIEQPQEPQHEILSPQLKAPSNSPKIRLFKRYV